MAPETTENNKKLPSAFESLAAPISSTFSVNTSKDSATSGLYGYRSSFDINAQKQCYQQQKQTQYQKQIEMNKQKQTQETQLALWCELCERSFKQPHQLERHMSEHEKCFYDGCNFEAHASILRKHIEAQHNSGLFNRIAKIETDEDVEKWRAERRKRYPTKENIETRRQAQEQRMKRGERLEDDKSRFGKNSDRRRAKEFNEKEKSQRPMRRKRQQNTRGKTKEMKVKANCDENIVEKLTAKSGEIETATEQQKNALTALVGYYGESSGDEGEDETTNAQVTAKEAVNEPLISESAATTAQPIEESEDDDGPPEEQPIERTTTSVELEQQETSIEEVKPQKRPNPKWSAKKEPPRKVVKRRTVLDMTRNIRNQNSLLEKLLQKEIRHERNVLLQCVRFVVESNFFGIGQNDCTK